MEEESCEMEFIRARSLVNDSSSYHAKALPRGRSLELVWSECWDIGLERKGGRVEVVERICGLLDDWCLLYPTSTIRIHPPGAISPNNLIHQPQTSYKPRYSSTRSLCLSPSKDQPEQSHWPMPKTPSYDLHVATQQTQSSPSILAARSRRRISHRSILELRQTQEQHQRSLLARSQRGISAIRPNGPGCVDLCLLEKKKKKKKKKKESLGGEEEGRCRKGLALVQKEEEEEVEKARRRTWRGSEKVEGEVGGILLGKAGEAAWSSYRG
ncbi:hypothetical protein KM043_001196 [Ampulex compressa]|nr:hypothetical protein KM043_001196 [Ampulex compressa]